MSNIPISTGTGAASVATETISGVSYQQIELYGAGGASVASIDPSGAVRVSVVGIPKIEVIGSVATSVTPPANQSVSGTVGSSIIGWVPVQLSNTSVISVNKASVAVVIIGGSVAASVTPAANQSVSGTVGSSVIGTVPVTQVTTPWTINSVYGNISGSVVGFQGGTRTISGSVLSYMAPLGSLVSGVTSIITGTAQVSVLATPAGGQRHHITHIMATNGSDTGTFVNIYSGPQIIYSGYAAASGGGFSSALPTPLRVPVADNAVGAATTAQGSVKVAITGFTAA